MFDPLISILLTWCVNSSIGEDWSIVCGGAGWLLSHKTCQDCKLHLLKGGATKSYEEEKITNIHMDLVTEDIVY